MAFGIWTFRLQIYVAVGSVLCLENAHALLYDIVAPACGSYDSPEALDAGLEIRV